MTHSPQNTDHNDSAQHVDHVIRNRKTTKILVDTAHCRDTAEHIPADFNDTVQTMIETAGHAPFHKAIHRETHQQGALKSPVPWRFYVLDQANCCTLLDYLAEQAKTLPGSKWARAWESKIPKLLAGVGALVLVTWLPDPTPPGSQPELNENNVEHVAAASAAVQNLLLSAEARGLYSYWGTGGILKDGDVFAYLGIPSAEILLGAVFIALPSVPADEIEYGKLRETRGNWENWAVWLNVKP